jgi:hypothetical protein
MQATTSVSNALSVAASFILGLFQLDDLICIMNLRDGEPPIHMFLPTNQIATKQFLSKLQADNEAGFNIYVCMNPFKADTKNRKKEFVARVAHVWCEMDDDSHLEEIKATSALPKPHFILRSSKMGNHKTDGKANPTDKFHVIWNVEDMPVAELESLERALVAFGNDPQAVDVVRVLRIPGFKNCKYVEQPMVELVSRPDNDALDDVQPYRREDFKVETHAAAAEFKQPQQVPEEIHEGGRNAALASVAGKLRYSGFDAADIEESLQLFNQSHCVPPLGEDEVQTIARSVGRYPKNTPITIRLNGKEISTDPIRVVNGAPQQQMQNTVEVVAPSEALTADMSDAVLDGRLGEIYQRRLKQFPIAYGWTALTTVAGVIVPPLQAETGIVIDPPRTNLYTVQIGPVGSGKSQVIEHVRKLLGLPNSMYSDLKAGSMEGLLKRLSKDLSSRKLMSPLLQDIDEWKHYFRKADIEGASFMTVMNTGFYKDHYNLAIARGKEIDFNCTISWIGGVVQEEYDDVIGLAAIGGFYDRLYQGVCPTGYMFDYFPFEGEAEQFKPVAVKIDGSVHEVARDWKKEIPTAGRAVEVAIRVAHICASFDGRSVLYGKDLEPAKAMLTQQMKVRTQFAPNVGENPDAKCQQKILQWLDRFAPNGEWMNIKELYRGIHANRFGGFIFQRSVHTLSSPYQRDVEVMTQSRLNARDLTLIRRIGE